ncbi:MAG: GntR family transcriptional regulator [Desulfovibrionales bacterium]|nr:GntR family transcriptional regulator [Desulfovibrionales bacterium]
MASAKRPILCQKIVTMLQGNAFSIGDRLPGERRLAELFSTSRNSIREALCNLEAMGYIDIREKSGCYLRTKEGRLSWEMLRKRRSAPANRKVLETLMFLAPKLAREEATHLSAIDIQKLEAATAKLGRAIVNFDLPAVSREYIGFVLELAEVSGNDYIILLMKELAMASQNFAHSGTSFTEVQIDALFAYHVELFNALKNGEAKQAEMLAERCMQTFHKLVIPEQ